MKPRLTPVPPAALQVRPPPAFAVHHVAIALQVAAARVRADQASADLRARDARERDRALRYVRVRDRQ